MSNNTTGKAEVAISEAHWSTNPNDSHCKDDADVTYAVIENGVILDIYAKYADAWIAAKMHNMVKSNYGA